MNEDSREEHTLGSVSTEHTLTGIQLVSESSGDPNNCVICQNRDPTNNTKCKDVKHLKELLSSVMMT